MGLHAFPAGVLGLSTLSDGDHFSVWDKNGYKSGAAFMRTETPACE